MAKIIKTRVRKLANIPQKVVQAHRAKPTQHDGPIIVRLDPPKKNTLHYSIKIPGRLLKYFRYCDIKTTYDSSIREVPLGILNIPAVGSLLAFAWYFGVDIHVDQLDRTYAAGVQKLREMLDTKFPGNLKSSKLLVKKETDCNEVKQGKILLYSGGVDALSSYLENKNPNLSLAHIVGSELGMSSQDRSQRASMIARFAKEEGVKAHFIRTNVRRAFEEREIGYALGERYNRWWFLAFAPMFFGLAAPLAHSCGSDSVLLSGAPRPNLKYIRAGLSITDKYLSWSSGQAVTSGENYAWYEKIVKFVNPHIKETAAKNKWFTHIYSCSLSPQACNHCVKCRSVIISLLSLGIDPNRHGYRCDSSTLFKTQAYIMRDKGFQQGTGWWIYLKDDLGKYAPTLRDKKLYGIGTFLSWFLSV